MGLRLRLALIYGGLLAVVGGALLGIAVYLVDQSVASSVTFAPGTQVEVRDDNGDGGLISAEQLREELRSQARQRVLEQGAVIYGLVVLAGAAAGYVVAARALGPIAAITATAQRLSTGTLGQRIDLQGPRDELKELADTFDAMIARLNAAFDSQRRFVANASHELRTPLTVMRTEVEVALADPDATTDELRRMGEVVRDATEDADRLVDSLLVLARSEAQAQQGLDVHEDVDLAGVVPATVRAVTPEAESHGLTVVSELQPAWVSGDPRLLNRLVGNLVENAVRHNVDGGWVKIRACTEPSQVKVTVANSGRLAESESTEDLFAPFRRAGAVRTGRRGTGLGLSIVRAITVAHGGEVTATRRPDGGLEVEVTLPNSEVSRQGSPLPERGIASRSPSR